ncbi:Calcium/proton exchanger [Pseudovirgaria hyperparasitica]|uniref:Calcium/proton exchanger n=1 Tax=Pseudovirgaria hyperparasitica TaxID=470096 RepID=A0A6A6VYN6_9PEZI|nr:Calcium/proton exchanger [Pseudovirgaria hyperparasitica]KAF2755335.1 Calcium/proton exchanger [Pseudovirgaria hyperparasitica]
MLRLDRVKSKARHYARSDSGSSGGFSLFRTTSKGSRRSLSSSQDIESGLQVPHNNASQTNLSDIQERASQGRISQDGERTQPTSSTTEHTTNGFSEKTSQGSGNSTEPTNGNVEKGIESGTRRRGIHLPFMRKGKDDSESSAVQDDEEKKKTINRNWKHNPAPIWQQVKFILLENWLNVLLVACPVGIALKAADSNPYAVFVVNFIAIIPLAGLLSNSTEQLALYTGETLGGLLNASFGNAVELIVSIQALVKGEIVIVKTSLIGSILSNLLLVLGMAFFFGGINRVEQFFNVTVAQTAASLLALSIGALIVPTVFRDWTPIDGGTEQETDLQNKVEALSRGTSIILLIIYGCYLFFQLKSHKSMYNEKSEKGIKRNLRGRPTEGEALKAIANAGAGSGAVVGGHINAERNSAYEPEEEDEEEELPELSVWMAVLFLSISTALVAVNSEFMVDGIDFITAPPSPVSKTFVGLILIPIVGNAAEHATAVTVAIKDKMDLAIGVAVGSSMQIALLVLPLIDVIGWITQSKDCMGNEMSLSFDGFQLALIFVAVLLVNYLIQDGKSHWLEGVLLMGMYIIIATAGWFYPTTDDCQA